MRAVNQVCRGCADVVVTNKAHAVTVGPIPGDTSFSRTAERDGTIALCQGRSRC